MARHQNLEIKLESQINASTDFLGVLSLGSVVLSGILLFTPVKAIGYIGVGCGLGAFTASVVTKRKHLQVAKQHVDGLKKHHRSEMDLQNDLLVSKDNEIYTLKVDSSNRFKKIQDLDLELKGSKIHTTQLQSKIDCLLAQSQGQKQLFEQLTEKLSDSLDKARQAVEESLDEWDKRLTSLVNTKRYQQYPKLAERLNQLLEQGQEKLAEYALKLAQMPKKWDSLADLLSLYYCVNDDLANVKTKCINAIEKLSNQEKEKDLNEWNESYQALEKRYKQLLKEYRSKMDECNRNAIENSNNAKAIIEEFTVKTTDDVEANWKNATDFVQRLKSEIQRLEEKIHHLSKPLEWRPATRADMKVANIIIRYFEQLGVILDRAGTDYKGYEATLWFLPDRTGRLVLADELNEHSDKLQALSHALNTPKFALEPESGLISVIVQLAKKPKADSKDIERLWTPASQFEKTVKGWSRVRLTGGSESGKSPTAENLAVAILKHRPGVGRLYNPQYDSVKNYWTIPTVGTSHKDSEKGIADLATQVDLRANSHQTRDEFELSIFDEVDSTMSHTKGKKSVIGGNVNFIIKQASHQNLGVIFIGQNANVSEYPGMDRSDWNSAVNVHIGANAYDAITNSNRFTSDEVSRLKQTADKITEFCHDKNTELGLEKTDPQAYRFALVIEPNKKPYFIELPAFGTYTFDQLQQHQQSAPTMVSATPDSTTQSLEPLKRRNSIGAAIEPQSGYVGSSCPSCNSTNRKKDGKYQGRQRYQCKDCGKRYTEGE